MGKNKRLELVWQELFGRYESSGFAVSANGNKNEERLVNVMGGTVIETESDKIKIQMIIELGQENGWSDEVILKTLQEKIICLPLNRAEAYLKQYGKQLV